ncbi:zinc ribbon domain-containing protein [Robertmurraya beringensis]|uniref:Zinc ribbon domain-containing protein n=1 Tax=Robertmurraya beringensis TaxID=641660 RepID=A0ABV6KSZ6_9BACI
MAVCADCGSGMHFKSDRRNGAYVVCGTYVKHSSSFCSSHIIEEKKLLKLVRNDAQNLMKSANNIDELYGLAEEKALLKQSSILKKIKSLENQAEKLSNQFNSLLSLHAEGIITKDQFKVKNQSISELQLALANRKMELESQLEQKKNQEKNILAFKRIVDNFLNLDEKDQLDMKQILQRMIDKIKVSEEGEIDIHYNLAP